MGTLDVTPVGGLASTGLVGGPFAPSSQEYTLQNTGLTSFDWTATKTQPWTTLSATSGTLAAGATATVTVSIDSGADTLTAGTYNDTVSFTNTTDGNGDTTRAVTLTVTAPAGVLAVTPAGDLVSAGPSGGPFIPSNLTYTLENTGGSSIDWTAAKTQPWTALSAVSGTLAAGATATVTVSIDAAASEMAAGTYNDTVSFTNTTNGTGSTTRAVILTISAPPGTLAVTPAGDFASSGVTGGPFTPASQAYTLENSGGTSIDWTAAKTQTWTTLSAVSGTLAAGATATVTVSINAAADALGAGTYNDTVSFTNTTNGTGNTSRAVTLTVSSPAGALAVSPAGDFASSGLVGGPFTPPNQAYTLENTGGTSISWTAAKTQSWTTLSAVSGTLAAGATATVSVSINSAANSLTAGTYNDTVSFTNTTNGTGNTSRAVTLTVSSPAGALAVAPVGGFASVGPTGGPFAPSSQAYTLENTGGTSISWTAAKTQSWTTLSTVSGTLAAGATATVTVSINSAANSLTAGTYNDTVSFTNTTNGTGNTSREVTLTVSSPGGALAVTPAGDFASSGPVGGPFTPPNQAYTLENTGGTSISWTAAKTQPWTTLSAVSGTLAAGATATVTVSINSAANSLTAGTYHDTVSFTNTTNGTGNTSRAVTLTVSSPAGALAVTPAGGLSSSGLVGGPFTPASQAYSLQNTGGSPVNWTAAKTQAWTSLSATSGTLAAGATATVTVSINAAANSLAVGAYSDTVSFTNTTNGTGNTTRPVALDIGVGPVLSVSPSGRNVTSDSGTTTFDVSNTGGGTMNWTAAVVAGGDWLTVSSGASGTGDGTVTVAFAANRTSSERVGILRVTAAGASGSPKNVTVTQASGAFSLTLGAARLTESAWIISRQYGRLTVTVTNPASIVIDRYVIYRKVGSGAFQVLQEVAGSAVAGTSWVYNDTFLEPGTGYTYRVVALNALGGTIGTSNDVTI